MEKIKITSDEIELLIKAIDALRIYSLMIYSSINENNRIEDQDILIKKLIEDFDKLEKDITILKYKLYNIQQRALDRKGSITIDSLLE